MRREWKVLSITDVVLNHTANESPWLKEHPECAYNCLNSPHLRPAYLLDRVLCRLSADIIAGVWKSRALNDVISSEAHLNSIRQVFKEIYLPKVIKFEL